MIEIYVANIINGAGVLFCIYANCLLSWTEKKKLGSLLAAVGSFLIVIGSYILESWPILILNVVWVFISLYGIKSNKVSFHDSIFALIFLNAITLLGVCFMLFRNWDMAAYAAVALYISGYYCFLGNLINRKRYLIYTIVGFVFVVMHNFLSHQYSVLFSEVIGLCVSIVGLILLYRNDGNFIPKAEVILSK